MRVESVRLRYLLVAPLRLGLGVVWLVSAHAAGASAASSLVLFAAGAFGLAFLLLNDPRAAFGRSPEARAPLPATARVAPAWLHAAHAALPSTAGLSVLAAVSLWAKPDLTGLLAGLLAGLGLWALVAAWRIDPGLYVEPRTGALFLDDGPVPAE